MVRDLRRLTHRARLTGRGQITVPKAIRDALGARPGDDIEFVSRDGELLVELRPKRSVLDFAGIAADAAAAIPPTAKAIDELIERGMTRTAIARPTGSPSRSRRSR